VFVAKKDFPNTEITEEKSTEGTEKWNGLAGIESRVHDL
jgi:hypothetical protein